MHVHALAGWLVGTAWLRHSDSICLPAPLYVYDDKAGGMYVD